MGELDGFAFRNIELHDEARLLELRNNPFNLEFFKSPRPVSAEDHAGWFISRFTDFKELQILAIFSNQLIGIVFIVPLDKHSGSISINVDPRYQSQGIGQELLKQMLVRADSLGFLKIEALIHVSNTKSILLFEKSGFIYDKKVSEFFNRYIRLSK